MWPPKLYSQEDDELIIQENLKRVVFIAGGVGINPLMSMLSHLAEFDEQQKLQGGLGFGVRFLYTVRDPGPGRRDVSRILFLERLWRTFETGTMRDKGKFKVFLTSRAEEDGTNGQGERDALVWKGNEVPFSRRRITNDDLMEALGPVGERSRTVCYICGVPNMTDELVEHAKRAEGMDPRHVLCEKWW